MTYTAEQIEDAFQWQYGVLGWTALHSGMVATVDFADGSEADLLYVDSTGGEDRGTHASVVIAVGDQHFIKEGYYASHYGFVWDGPFYEATPAEKTIVSFERI